MFELPFLFHFCSSLLLILLTLLHSFALLQRSSNARALLLLLLLLLWRFSHDLELFLLPFFKCVNICVWYLYFLFYFAFVVHSCSSSKRLHSSSSHAPHSSRAPSLLLTLPCVLHMPSPPCPWPYTRAPMFMFMPLTVCHHTHVHVLDRIPSRPHHVHTLDIMLSEVLIIPSPSCLWQHALTLTLLTSSLLSRPHIHVLVLMSLTACPHPHTNSTPRLCYALDTPYATSPLYRWKCTRRNVFAHPFRQLTLWTKRCIDNN